MIRHVALWLLLAATALGASAQREYRPELYVGGHAGATLSRQQFVPSTPQSWLPGFVAGGVLRYTEERHFGLQVELNIQQRGWRERFDGTSFAYSRRLTYLQLPLLTHIYFGSDRFRCFFNAGPEVAWMIASGVSANFDYRHYQDVEGLPLQQRTNEQLSMDITGRLDYGLSGGVGCEMRLRGRHVVDLEARFYYGIGNIFPSSKADVFSASRGMSLEVMLAYLTRL